MKSIYIITQIAVIASLIIFSACEKTITNFEYKNQPKKIVLNGVFYNDSTMQINLSQSLSINESIFKLKQIENAQVYLLEDNETIGSFTHVNNGFYSIHGINPKDGATYKVTADASGFNNIYSTMKMPYKPQVISISQRFSNENQYSDCLNCGTLDFLVIDIKLKKTPNIKNYFSIAATNKKLHLEYEQKCETYSDNNQTETICRPIMICDTTYYEDWTSLDCKPLIVDTIGTYNQNIEFQIMGSHSDFYLTSWNPQNYLCYFGETHYANKAYFSVASNPSDEYVYSIKIPINNLHNEINNQISLSINAYDEAIYKHLHSLARSLEMEENPLAEKIAIYTNITNGLGIFSGVNNLVHEFTHIYTFNPNDGRFSVINE